VVYDHAYKTYDGRPANKLIFVTWLPLNSTTHQQMAYTHGKKLLREQLTGVFDCNARYVIASVQKRENSIDSKLAQRVNPALQARAVSHAFAARGCRVVGDVKSMLQTSGGGGGGDSDDDDDESWMD
jgi:hypothetical protein